MSHLNKIFVLFIVSLTMIPIVSVAGQQSSTTSGAELSVLPIGQIPSIIPNQETTINLRYTDNFGMNWTRLQNFYGNTGIRKIMSFIVTRVIWPIIHPTWKPFLGYTSVILNAEVVGNPEGWIASVDPTTIPMSTDGTTTNLSLKVYMNDLTAVNTVTIRISATRILKDGKTEYGTSYFDIPVRSGKLNFLGIKPDAQVKTVSPDSMVTFHIDVTNRGYFVDTFAAKVSSDAQMKGSLSESSFVLQPGETRDITLTVMTADVFFDPGTTHTITIEAYSLRYPANRFTGQVQVTTRGFYVSWLVWFGIGLVIFILIVLFLLIRYIMEWRYRRLCGGKPDKPWTIPEERRYLEELKTQDKEEYNKVLRMMGDEYHSAMLWYKDYCRAMREGKKERTERSRLLARFSKKEEQTQKEQQHKETHLTTINEGSTAICDPEKTQQQRETVTNYEEFTRREEQQVDRKKDKALLKIQRKQEKQKKKIKP